MTEKIKLCKNCGHIETSDFPHFDQTALKFSCEPKGFRYEKLLQATMDAANEIEGLRHMNQVLGARTAMFDDCMALLFARPQPQPPQVAQEDIVWKLRKIAEELQSDSR